MALNYACVAVALVLHLYQASAGQVLTCGSNNNGQIGDGTTTTQPVLSAVSALAGQQIKAIASGGSHSAALTTGGSLFMWGYNYYGQVGDGGIGYRPLPKLINVGGQAVASLSLGEFHTSALTTGGDLYLWGSNFYCQVGDGTLRNQKQLPVRVSIGANKVATIGAGGSHSGAVTSAGLYLWGRNNAGQVGVGLAYYWQPTPTLISVGGEVVVSISLGALHSGAVTAAGHLYMWGSNVNGQLGDGTVVSSFSPKLVKVGGASNQQFVQSISLGGDHSGAVVRGGNVFMWGLNDHGQVGDNTVTARLTPAQVSVPCSVKNVTLGPSHSGAVCAAGAVYVWGWNVDGRLGDGTKVDRLVPTRMSLAVNADGLAAGGAHTLALTAANVVLAAAVTVASDEVSSAPADNNVALYALFALVPVCGLVGFFVVQWLRRPKEVEMEIDQPAVTVSIPCELPQCTSHVEEICSMPCPTLEPEFVQPDDVENVAP